MLRPRELSPGPAQAAEGSQEAAVAARPGRRCAACVKAALWLRSGLGGWEEGSASVKGPSSPNPCG